MPKALLVAYVQHRSDGEEAEFNRWYDQVHIPQVVDRIPGVVSGRRYKLSTTQLVSDDDTPEHRYLTLYELDTDDLAETAKRLGDAGTDGTLDMSDTIDATSAPILHFYTPTPDGGAA
jgi:hypothetical protein